MAGRVPRLRLLPPGAQREGDLRFALEQGVPLPAVDPGHVEGLLPLGDGFHIRTRRQQQRGGRGVAIPRRSVEGRVAPDQPFYRSASEKL